MPPVAPSAQLLERKHDRDLLQAPTRAAAARSPPHEVIQVEVEVASDEESVSADNNNNNNPGAVAELAPGDFSITRTAALSNQMSSLSLQATVPFPESLVQSFKKLLLSDKFSDIKFVCDDRKVILHAHRFILAAASPYFLAAFEGSWAENNKSGEWLTSHPSEIIKAVLSFLYTGRCDAIGEFKYPELLHSMIKYLTCSLLSLLCF